MSRHFYNGWDRQLVEVLVEGTWHSGLLRSWDQARDASWSGMVEWSTGPAESRLDRFAEASIRPGQAGLGGSVTLSTGPR